MGVNSMWYNKNIGVSQVVEVRVGFALTICSTNCISNFHYLVIHKKSLYPAPEKS